MKKGLKIFIWSLLILCIVGFACTYYFLYANRSLAGEKLTDGIYKYDADIDNHTKSVTFDRNNIYVLVEKEKKYELYKNNIYKNKTEKVGEIDSTENLCYFDDIYLYCLKDGKRTIYNFKLKKLYEGKDEDIIYYKKGIIKIKDNTIYYKNKEYGKVSGTDNQYFIGGHYMLDDNIYISLITEEDERCLYNFNKKKCEDYNYILVGENVNNLILYDTQKLYITSEENGLKEYDKPFDDEYYYNGKVRDDLLYYFYEQYLKVYDFKTNKIKLIDYRIKDPSYNSILVDNYFILISDFYKIYVFNLDEIKYSSDMTLEELDAEFNRRIDERVESINKKYDVTVLTRDKADLKLDVWKTSTEGERRIDYLNDSLDETEEVLESMGDGFGKEFIHGDRKGLRIYIVKKIISEDSVAGLSFGYYDTYTILADTYDYKRTLYHELMHSMESNLEDKNKNAFNKWTSYNPKGYKYKGEYDPYALLYKYSAGYYGADDAYFIDNYAQTNYLEDKARVFENICMHTVDDIKQYPSLLKKAEYLKSELIKYYPMLDGSVIFDSLK